VFLYACKNDLFEVDLNQEQVTLLAPANNLTATNGDITFWWEEVEGAIKYNLQIASPDFNNIQQLELDITTSSNKHDYSLTPGIYEWRIKAENGSSETVYSTRTLIIDSSATGDKIPPAAPTLISPNDLDTSTSTAVLLVWNRDVSAIADSLYVFVTDTNTLVSGYPIYITDQNHSFNGDTITTYYWKLRSRDDAGNWSIFSSWRQFYIK